MDKKKLFILLSLFLIVNVSYSQLSNFEKYWYYKNRL